MLDISVCGQIVTIHFDHGHVVLGYVIYVMSQHDKCYSIPLYTFGSVLGPKHGLGKNTIKNVIPENNLGFCFWMDGL